LHAVIKSQGQDMPRAFPEGEAAPYPRSVGQAHFKDVREDDLCRAAPLRRPLNLKAPPFTEAQT
jgi:hypothetical protein